MSSPSCCKPGCRYYLSPIVTSISSIVIAQILSGSTHYSPQYMSNLIAYYAQPRALAPFLWLFSQMAKFPALFTSPMFQCYFLIVTIAHQKSRVSCPSDVAQWLSINPCTKRSQVQIPVRAHAWVVGSFPSNRCEGGSQSMLMFFSL
uniref:Uncharacterized protein n=1 Tax=Pipistrellus kuhlii TaxID=59472 RepID=A0A7J7XV58_PIPKU|nr:hypothetical protein mPipKuh1_010478 [Pipistrellus kuhlii]